jgi:hypothetical protein
MITQKHLNRFFIRRQEPKLVLQADSRDTNTGKIPDYQLNVALNEANNELTGSAEITYTNNSPDQLSFLWLQLIKIFLLKIPEGMLSFLCLEVEMVHKVKF